MSPVRSAMSVAYRAPSPNRSKPEGCWSAPPVGCSNPGQSASPPPQRPLPHTNHFSQRADSPRVYCATLTLLDHPPCHMIAESGELWPGSSAGPLWPLKSSPSPAAFAAGSSRRLIVLAVILKTDGLASPRNCRNCGRTADSGVYE